MAITNTAAFAQTTKTGSVVATAASSINTDTPSEAVLIGTAGADGAILTKLSAIPRATVGDALLYLYISKDSGTTKRVVDSVLLASRTVSSTVVNEPVIFERITESTPIRLEAGDVMYVSSAVALSSGIAFSAEWTDF